MAGAQTTQAQPAALDTSRTRPRVVDTLGQAQERLKEKINQAPESPPRWKAMLQMLAYGLGKAQQAHPAQDWQGFASNVGEGVGYGAAALAKPKVAGELNRGYEIERRWQELKVQQQIATTESGIEYRRAESQHLNAQAKHLNDPKPKRMVIKQDAKGRYVAVDADTGLDGSGRPVQGKMPADSNDWILHVDESGQYVPVNRRTGRGQDGKPVKGHSTVRLDDGTFIDSSQKYAADMAAGRETRAVDRDNERAGQENSQIKGNIASATKERDGLGEALKTTPPTVTKKRVNEQGDDETYEVPNPVYEDYMRRYRSLDDDIRRYNGQIKPTVSSNPAGLKPPKK